MYHIIVNPESRTGKGKNLWSMLVPVLEEQRVEYTAHFSERAGHIIDIIRDLCTETFSKDSDSILKLIVLGGDGTLNEALQGITDFNRVELGYVPTGSSNDMARDLGLSKNPIEALKNVLNCKEPFKMDLGTIKYNNSSTELSRQYGDILSDVRNFGVSTGIGYDASICEEALSSPIKRLLNKMGLGKLIYLVIALKQLISTKRKDARMVLDDERVIDMKNMLFIATMIHRFEGGGFMFGPDADCSDGVMDICAVSDVSKLKVLLALPTATKGKHFKYKGIEKYTARKINIETAEPLWVHTDGEVSRKSNFITITCEKQAVKMLK